MKKCSKCGRTLPLDRFGMTSAHGTRYPRADCKDCRALYAANWLEANRTRIQPGRTNYCRTWRERNRTTYNASTRRRRLARRMPESSGRSI